MIKKSFDQNKLVIRNWEICSDNKVRWNAEVYLESYQISMTEPFGEIVKH